MISKSRMKKDLIGQTTIIGSLLLLLLFAVPSAWLLTLLVLLGTWQAGSAVELRVQYEYRARQPYIWILPLMIVLLLVLKPLLGGWIILGTALTLISYYIITARDFVIVRRRPRSFWDI